MTTKVNPTVEKWECPHCDKKHMDGYIHNPKTCSICRIDSNLPTSPMVEKWEFKCDRCKKVEKVPEFVAEHLRGKNPPWCNKCEDEYRYWLNNPNQAHSVQEAKAEMSLGRNWYFEGDELVITRGKWVIDRYKKHTRSQSAKPKFGTDFWYGKVRGSDHVPSTTKMMDEAYLSVTNDLPNRGEE